MKQDKAKAISERPKVGGNNIPSDTYVVKPLPPKPKSKNMSQGKGEKNN